MTLTIAKKGASGHGSFYCIGYCKDTERKLLRAITSFIGLSHRRPLTVM